MLGPSFYLVSWTFLLGDDGPAASRYLKKKSTMGGDVARSQNTRREINALEVQKTPSDHCSLAE
eukprot:6204988-Pleurochrysis_carterae.AAC.1